MSPITHMCQEVMCRGYYRKPRPDRHFLTLVRHGTWRDWAAKSVPNGRDGSWASAAAPGCSSCSQPISILHGPPLAMGAPCGRFRAGVRWLQVGTQLGMGMVIRQGRKRAATELCNASKGVWCVREDAPASGCRRLTSPRSKPSILPSPASSMAGTSSGLIMSYVLGTTCRVNGYNLW